MKKKPKLVKKNCIAGAIQELNQDKTGYVFLLVFVLLFALVCADNWVYLAQRTNSDIGGEFLYMQKVCETGNPFTPEYVAGVELFFSRPWMIFALFYAFGKNMILSAKLTVITTWLLMVLSTGYMFRMFGWRCQDILLALSVLFGMACLEIRIFLYMANSGYGLLFIGLTMSLGILADAHRQGCLKHWQAATYIGVAFYFGLCSIRMFFWLYGPVFLVEFVRYIRDRLKGVLSSSTPKILVWGGVIANLTGMGIFNFVLIPYMHAVKLHFTTISMSSLWQKLTDELITVLRAFGIELTGASVFSLAAIAPIYMIILAGVLIWGVGVLKKEQYFSETENRLLLYLLVSLCLMIFAATITTTETGLRYLIALPVITAIVSVSIYRYLNERRDLRSLRWLFCVFLAAGVCVSTANIYRKPADITPEMQVAEHLQDTGVDRIAGTYWNINILKFLSNGKLKGNAFVDAEPLPMYDWCTDRTQYVNDDEPITLILTPAERDDWQASEKRGHLLSLADGEEEVAGYTLYHYQNNPLGFDLLAHGVDARFNFLSLGYFGGAYLEDDKIVLPTGATQCGPFISLPAGTYDVVIRGEDLTSGTFSLLSNGTALEVNDLTIGPDKVTYSFETDTDLPSVECACVNYGEVELGIKDITVTPRDRVPIWE